MDTRTRETGSIKAISFFLGIVYLVTGGAKLAGLEMMIQSFQNWGYPIAFMYLVGALEVIGALMVFVSRTRFYGATLIAVLMIGATFTHLLAGEWILAPAPLVMLIMAGTVIWAERAGTPRPAYPREHHA